MGPGGFRVKSADGESSIKIGGRAQVDANIHSNEGGLDSMTTDGTELRRARFEMKGTLPHDIIGRWGSGRVLMRPVAPGTGVIAGGPVRAVLEAAGVTDVLTKSLGTNNPINVVRATMEGLGRLVTAEQIAAERGISVQELVGTNE